MKTGDLNWQTWLKNGDQYLNAATPKNKTSRFGTDIRYNLLSMSLEGYIMAILDYHGDLPENHTYTDLVLALERVVPIDDALKKRILAYENLQSICSIDKYSRKNPTEMELVDLKGAIDEISRIAHKTCAVDLRGFPFSGSQNIPPADLTP
jgi:hypothetical protein